jgi:C4-type Zn-finger protein
MRQVLLDEPGVRIEVRYTEKTTRRALNNRCPVCRSALRAIRNRTLEGDRVVLGYRCGRCGYWTHLRRRVPVRYRFVRVGIDGQPME